MYSAVPNARRNRPDIGAICMWFCALPMRDLPPIISHKAGALLLPVPSGGAGAVSAWTRADRPC
jgi:hypothetical protein